LHEFDGPTLRWEKTRRTQAHWHTAQYKQSTDAPPKYSGSAIFQIGRTKVHAHIDGPKQLQYKAKNKSAKISVINVRFFMANFANYIHKADPKKEV
jgi:hypothetical protein